MNEAKDPTGTAATIKIEPFQSRKVGLFWYDWYSICSRHRPHKAECLQCQTGDWICRWKQKAGHLIFKAWPWLWRLWANRSWSPRRKKLEEWFPGLKRDKDES